MVHRPVLNPVLRLFCFPFAALALFAALGAAGLLIVAITVACFGAFAFAVRHLGIDLLP